MANSHLSESTEVSTLERTQRAIGPIAAGMILDAGDLMTFGPLGIYAGFLVGSTVGFWLTGMYGFKTPARLFWSCVAGIYCTAPFTEVFPIATLISATHRFAHAGATQPR